MSWNFDIRDRMREAHGGQIPHNIEGFYWELNLMVHLLEGLTYQAMSSMLVSDTMLWFKNRVNAIDNVELPTAKPGIANKLDALAAVFQGSNPTFTMYNIYTQSLPPLNKNLILGHFDGMRGYVGDDTLHRNGPCDVCIPFLHWQRTGTGFPPKDVMDRFLGAFGNYDLHRLIDEPYHSLSDEAKAILREAKQHGILTTARHPVPGGKTAKSLQFKNGLFCDPAQNTCVARNPDDFCLLSSTGTCSAAGG